MGERREPHRRGYTEANKFMRCATSPATKEIYIKTAVRHQCTPVRWEGAGGETDNARSSRTCRNQSPMILPAEMQNATAVFVKSWAIPYEIKHALSISPSNPTSKYLPKRNEN